MLLDASGQVNASNPVDCDFRVALDADRRDHPPRRERAAG
jgi:hypothetical protein